MADELPTPSGFRRRLTFAFVVVAVGTGTLLALTSYIAIRSYRIQTFNQRARRDARLALLAAPQPFSAAAFDDLVRQYERRGGFETVGVAGDVQFASNAQLSLADVPSTIRSPSPGEISSLASVTLAGQPYGVLAGRTSGGTTRLYFFFRRDGLLHGLDEIRNVLLVTWLVTLVGAALFGRAVAKRTLRPVASAADRSIALAEELSGAKVPRAPADEFERLSAAFTHLVGVVHDKVSELSERARRDRQFTADLAHELRTPLTTLASTATVLQNELPDGHPNARRALALHIQATNRLESLVVELLELAPLNAESPGVQLRPISVREALQDVLEPRAQRPPVLGDADLIVLAEPSRFRRVVANLLDNAERHAGGAISITVSAHGPLCCIDVTDAGPGIPDDAVDRVFDRFYKTDTSRSSAGSGLGLAIARENAFLQVGALSVRNHRIGCTFRFTLERVPVEQPRADELAPDVVNP